MMKKNVILSLIFIVVGVGTQVAFGQRRPCVIPATSFTPIVNHATCFNVIGASIDFEATGPDGSYLKNLILKDASGTTIYNHGTYGSMTGSILNLSTGVYTFSGAIVVEYVCNGISYITAIPISQTVWVGIQTVWSEKIDMISSPNSYSALRNATVATYGGVRSSNGIDSGNGWIEMKAQYGTTTNSRVYWLIGETNPLGTFSPNSQIQFIEFYKSSSGNGIRIKYQSGGLYLYATLSTNPDDKIRLVRTGATLTVQKNNSSTAIFTLPTTYTGSMNIAVRSLAQNDGCLDVVSSFGCRLSQNFVSHAEVKRKLDGGYTLAVENGLKFTFDGEYEVTNGTYITYAIYDNNHEVKGSSDSQGNVSSGAIALTYSYDDNRYTLDLSGLNLTSDDYYMLEVIDSKGTKKYLKFLFKY